ncbi:hypothetical protein GGF46_001625 [Coemansia sp. RSA 552]|nr:hypothetical protein GGF46_001625 [Coemansia sp. RSA 552]
MVGAPRPPPGSQAAGAAPGSSGSGLGAWGSMFKSALNQMETHLDRYLEIPDGQQPPNARPPPRSASRSALRSATPTTSRPATPARRTPTPLSRKPSSALQHESRKAAPAQSTASGSARDGEEDMDADLLDAFGVDLDDSQSAPATERPRRSADTNDFAISARTASPAPRSQAATPIRRGDSNGTESSGSQASSEAPEAPAEAPQTERPLVEKPQAEKPQAENPYIQAELKKLRAAEIPAGADGMRQMIEEQRRRIEALLVEGQSWSTKELRLSNTIKRLRTDSKGLEKTTQLVQRRLEQSVASNAELNEKLKQASLSDRSSLDSAKALKARLRDADGRRSQLEHELRVAAEARSSFKTALSSAEAEMAALRSELATAKAQQDQRVQKAQAEALAEAEQRVAQARQQAGDEKQRLQAQIDELQQRVLMAEEESRDREVASLTQIRTLRAQLRGAESQSREIGGEIQQHTAPLLQQIEDLQTRQTEQRREWLRKENEWAAQAREAAKHTEALQAQLSERAALVSSAKESAAAEGRRAESVRAEVAALKHQLLAEAKIRAEMKQQLEEARGTVREQSARLESAAALRVSPAETASRSASPAVTQHNDRPGTSHTRNLSASSLSSMGSRSRRGTDAMSPTQPDGAAPTALAVTKKLSSQITSLKAQLQTALRQKDEYSRNLVDQSVEMERMRSDAAELASLRRELDGLQHRHETALVMLGEKTEEVIDLQADIKDAKHVYQQQLQALLPEK